MTKRNVSSLAGLVLTILSLAEAGCRSRPSAGEPPADPKTKGDLRMIGMAYHNYQSTHNKPPAKVEDLQDFIRENPAAYQALKDGRYVFTYGVAPMDALNAVVGYEKDVPTRGGLVVMGTSEVKYMSALDFQAAPKAKAK